MSPYITCTGGAEMDRLQFYERSRSKTFKSFETPDARTRTLQKVCTLCSGTVVRDGAQSVLRVERAMPVQAVFGSAEEGARLIDAKALHSFVQLAGAGSGRRVREEDLIFFDVETTGLSGGAGTTIFLAGFGSISEGEVRIVQYFLNDLSSERLFLRLISDHLLSDMILVSYNGKSFDYNIIRNRFILNRISDEGLNHIHLDLLHSSRRLWKGMFPDFSLGTVERMALGVMRTDDIPGFLIPDVYFDYLKGANVTEKLGKVFSHNRLDVLSLLALFEKQLDIITSGLDAGTHSPDRELSRCNFVSLAEYLMQKGFLRQAKYILCPHKEDPAALKRLALLCKRQKQSEEALRYFTLLTQRARVPTDYIFACTEAAKLYEHVFKDFQKAIVYAEKAKLWLSRSGYLHPELAVDYGSARFSVEKRLIRLRRKLRERNAGNAPHPAH